MVMGGLNMCMEFRRVIKGGGDAIE